MNRVGSLVKETRLSCRLSQGRLSKLIGLPTSQYISNIERAKSGISIKYAKRICNVLEIKNIEMRTAMVLDYAEELKTKWGKVK